LVVFVGAFLRWWVFFCGLVFLVGVVGGGGGIVRLIEGTGDGW